MYFSSGIPTKIDSWGRHGYPYSPHHWVGTGVKRGRDGFDDVNSAREPYCEKFIAQPLRIMRTIQTQICISTKFGVFFMWYRLNCQIVTFLQCTTMEFSQIFHGISCIKHYNQMRR